MNISQTKQLNKSKSSETLYLQMFNTCNNLQHERQVILLVASLRLVSPGAATDSVTHFLLKNDELFLVNTSAKTTAVVSSQLETF